MKPAYFDGYNAEIAKEQAAYITLPAHIDDYGVVYTCWGLTLMERVKILFTGRVWHSQLTFSEPMQPIKLQVNKANFTCQ